jgi:rod shape determining protein RodA
MRLRAPESSTATTGFGRRLRLALDPWVILPALVILAIALAALFSVVYHPVAFEIQPDLASDLATPFTKQVAWAGLGLLLMTMVAMADLDALNRRGWLVYAGGLLLLVAVLTVGVKVRNIRAWLSIAGFTFQPSELVKVALVIALARFLAYAGRAERPLASLLGAAILVGIPSALVLKQPDMGTVIVYLSLLLTVPFVAGLPSRYMILILLSGGLAVMRLLLAIANEHLAFLPHGVLSTLLADPAPARLILVILLVAGTALAVAMRILAVRGAFAVWLFSVVPIGAFTASFALADHLKEYQKIRLLAFIAPQLDPKGSGYNIIQSQIAFGSGGLFGKGFHGATQSALGFLPERQTDFIFSVVGEVFGLAGAALLLLAFLVLFLRILWIASQARTLFGSLLAIGVVTILVTHVVVNMGMAIGIMPIMGIPLPLASYGGTAVIAVFLMLGAVLAVERDSRL